MFYGRAKIQNKLNGRRGTRSRNETARFPVTRLESNPGENPTIRYFYRSNLNFKSFDCVFRYRDSPRFSFVFQRRCITAVPGVSLFSPTTDTTCQIISIFRYGENFSLSQKKKKNYIRGDKIQSIPFGGLSRRRCRANTESYGAAQYGLRHRLSGPPVVTFQWTDITGSWWMERPDSTLFVECKYNSFKITRVKRQTV